MSIVYAQVYAIVYAQHLHAPFSVAATQTSVCVCVCVFSTGMDKLIDLYNEVAYSRFSEYLCRAYVCM